jgi:diguanylate cyclase (GGDEF)-like protein/PAS domain S-box-containing protein
MTGQQQSLLVVDDAEANRDVLSRRLAARGYSVRQAAGGDEALALAAAHRFDLVLLDIEMPGISGLDVLTRLRESRSQVELPVIMVTARTEGATIVEAFRLGANDYVTKPVDFPVALARIRTHLAHKLAVEALRESEERYAVAAEGARDGLWDWKLSTNVVHWSPRWKAMLGFDEAELGSNPDEWLSRIHDGDQFGVKARLAAHLARGGGSHFESEHRLRHRNGTYRWVLCRAAAVRNEAGDATRLAGSFTDVTEAKVSDLLTGLPNRHLFIDLLDRAVKRAHRRPSYRFALLVLGLDRFTAVNDTLGPVTADRLLGGVARRLQPLLRPTDAVLSDAPALTLARLGGGEFHVLVDDITDDADAIRVADRLRSAFATPFHVDGHDVCTTASAGIALSTAQYERSADVLRDAAIALHRARTDGGGGCQVFGPGMRDEALASLLSMP